MRTPTFIAALLAASISGSALAKGDAQAGAEKAAPCHACHGADGLGTAPIYPILAGQHEDYLAHALRAYRSGDRKNVIMAGFAGQLSDADIADLAAFYAAQPDGVKTLQRQR